MSHFLSNVVAHYKKPLLGVLLAGLVASTNATTYLIVPSNSNARFEIDHFGTSTNSGGFYNITGQLQYDPAAKVGNISVVIPVNSLNTGNKAFDNVLISPDFFDADEYPLISFESTDWYFADTNASAKSMEVGDVVKVDGNLTMHGITHPVTLNATKFNCYFSFIAKSQVCGGDFTTTIDRRKWDISKYTLLGITETVQLKIQIEAAKQ